MADIFLSYASADREAAHRLAGRLIELGYSVWWDRTIPPGRQFDEVIQEALHTTKCVIVLWSAHSVRSNWVKTEAAEALALAKLVPALIDDVAPPMEFKRIQAADLSGWDGDTDHPEYRSLIGSVEGMLTGTAGVPVVDHRTESPHARWDARGPRSPRPQRGSALRSAGQWMMVIAVLAGASALGGYLLARSNPQVFQRAASTGAPADPSSSPPAPSSSSAERDRRSAESSSGRQSRSTATRPAENASRPTAPVGTSSTTVTESERVADSGAPAAPAPRSTGQGRRINLLLARNGGEIVVAAHELWHMVVDGKEETSAWLDTGEAVFSFKDGRPATFDAFAILVPRTVDYNLRTFELLAGNEGPMGYFESVGTFETENVRVIRNPFQEFRFPPVRARYLKVKAMRSHSGGSASLVHEFALYGTLD